LRPLDFFFAPPREAVLLRDVEDDFFEPPREDDERALDFFAVLFFDEDFFDEEDLERDFDVVAIFGLASQTVRRKR
jgi:hypothetical protein